MKIVRDENDDINAAYDAESGALLVQLNVPDTAVKGEIINANASGNTALPATLYPAGSSSPVALGGSQYLYITDVTFVSTAGGVYNMVFGNADGAGLRIVKGNASPLGGVSVHFNTPLKGPAGAVPNMIAAAGQVDVIFSGYISNT